MIKNVDTSAQIHRQSRLVLRSVFIAAGKTKNIHKGFSFIEYLATLTIAASLLLMTSANFQPVLDRSRVISASGEFHAAISLARAEAVRRHTRVDLIPSDANDWAKGWLVLIDTNNNQHFDSGDLSLHRSHGEMKGLLVESKLRDSKKMYLAFDSSGRPRSADSPQVPQFGSFIFSVGTQRRKIIMSFLGRVRLCDPDKKAATC
jgi:type IV fimbrial biogenesis protein FimT